MRRKAVLMSLALLAVFAFASVALGQCAMCRTSLAGSNNSLFIRNFNIGVLVLLIPPVTIFCSIFFALRRFKDESAEEDQTFENGRSENRIEDN